MRKIIILLSSCIALLLLGYTSYRGYQVWRQTHGIAMAKGYLAEADARNAMLALKQVLLTNPRNLEASRMMADLVEAEHSPATLPAALQWRQHVTELDPVSNDDRLALAQTAILAKNYPLATNALAGVDDAGKKTANYHNIAGMAALMGGQITEAEAHFSESIRLDPANPIPQMNLAMIRLHFTNALDMAEARIALQRIIADSTNSALRVQARRTLIDDAMRFKDFPTALNLSKDLVRETNSAFTDKLLRLEVLGRSKNAEFKPTLALYQAEAAANPAKVADLATWQLLDFPATNTLTWLQQLPMQTRTNQLVEILTATCLLQLGDWRGLHDAIQHQTWNDPADNQEFMRHAFLARSLRGQDLKEASTGEWGLAIKAINEQKYLEVQRNDFRILFDLAIKWGWNAEIEQILWIVVNQYPDEKKWAYPMLRTKLIKDNNRTASLLQLFKIEHKQTPDDLDAKNDLASTALLLGDQESKPYQLAQEVYEKDPKNPYFASTYAFSLYRQGKFADALKVMQQLPPNILQDPSIAGYYGLILKANGNKAEAKEYFSRTSQGQLLPEEQALFNQAKAEL